MIRHMLFWNLTGEAPERETVLTFLKGSLEAIAAEVPGFLRWRVGADLGLGTHDVALYCEFRDQAALEAYQRNPRHQEMKEKGKAWLTGRVAADLEETE
ncbi:MAG: Dabb family protein [Intestinimonas sp.]|jgi:quinol monooxygenase YgiN|nr:Dabb family protein [Intestinimonas sp.]